ncbi:glycerophosphoryl diester phosphodiesterase membrane domain-containing protein [Dermabacteraceae bacterium TAE3-ERU27]|nr:glycerophosphoryl diester phosphodiesterase membrane domain-containing protein [Dermabacteraceae bacterium TAE3-ERU27]
MSSPNEPTGQAPQYPWANPSGASSSDNAATKERPSYGLPDPNAAQQHSPAPETAAAQRSLPEADQFMPLRPLGLGDILGCGMRFSRVKPKVIFGVSLVFYTFAFLVATIVTSFTSQRYFASTFSPTAAVDIENNEIVPDGTVEYLIGSLGSSFITIIVTTLLAVAITPLVHAAVTGRELKFEAAISSVRKHTWQVLLLMVLYIAASVAVPALIGSLFVGLGFLMREYVAAVVVIAVLGVLASLFGLLFVFTRFLFSPYALVLEDLSAVAAMKRSWQLTSGRAFWRILGISLLTMIIYSLLQQVLTILPGIVAGIATAILILAFPGHPVMLGIIMTVMIMLVAFLVVALTQPLLTASYIALFYDTKIRREGYDVQLQRELRESRS